MSVPQLTAATMQPVGAISDGDPAAVAVAFLRQWSPDGPWAVAAIEPTESKDQRPQTAYGHYGDHQLKELRDFIDRYQGKWNLYFTPNRPILGLRTNPKKNEIAFITCLHVDLDLPKGTEHTPEAFALLLAKINALSPLPTLTIFSGGGYQAFRRFPAPLPASEHTDRIEKLNERIESQIGGDRCHNVNRLMRLPGTINVLSATKRAAGRQPALAHVVDAAAPTALSAAGVAAHSRRPLGRVAGVLARL
jgi:hypothetical protein